jgi:hypothetical protein
VQVEGALSGITVGRVSLGRGGVAGAGTRVDGEGGAGLYLGWGLETLLWFLSCGAMVIFVLRLRTFT